MKLCKKAISLILCLSLVLLFDSEAYRTLYTIQIIIQS